jgi:alpha-tubulin suppressor-like RCC1 family protein/cytoskeletal protein CcmA (bactofilin family)
MLKTTLYTNNFIGNVKVIGNINSVNIFAENIYGNLTSNTWSPGNITDLTITGNVTAGYFLGNGALLTGISASGTATSIVNGSSNVTVASNGNVTMGVAGVADVLTVSNTSLRVNGNVYDATGQLYSVAASYMKAVRLSSQSIDHTIANLVYTSLESSFGSDISLDTTTGVFTLAPGKTYRLRGMPGRGKTFSTTSNVAIYFYWYNNTTSQVVGSESRMYESNSTVDESNPGGAAEYIMTPAVTTTMSLNIYTSSGTAVIGDIPSGIYSWADIQVIAGQAPITIAPTANLDISGNVIGAYANVTTVIATSGNVGNVRLVGGNIETSGQVNVLGNVVAGYLIGNGSQLSGITSFTLPATANIDIVGNVSAPGNVVVAGQVNVTGNVSGHHFIGNGSQLSGVVTALPSVIYADVYGNVSGSRVTTGNSITLGDSMATGNVSSGGYFVGNGYYMTLSGLTLIPQGNVANSAVRLALNVPAGSLMTQEDNGLQYLLTALPTSNVSNWLNFTGANFPVPSVFGRTGAITASINDYNDSQIQLSANVGTATIVNHVSDALAYLNINKANVVNGNISASFFIGNISAPVVIATYGNVGNTQFLGGNVAVSGQINALGNVAASFFVGNGSLLTGLSLALTPTNITNGSSTVNIATLDGPITMTAGGVANSIVVSTNLVEVGRALTVYGDLKNNMSNSSAAYGNYAPVVIDTDTNILRKKPVEMPRFGGSTTYCDTIGEVLMFMYKNQIVASGLGFTSSTQVGGYIQYNPSLTPACIPSTTTSPITGFTNMYNNEFNAAALTTDGRVFSWGAQYGTSSVSNYIPMQISIPGNVAQLSGGSARPFNSGGVITYGSFAAILGNGQLYMWGVNEYGTLGRGTVQTSNNTPAIPNGLASANVAKVLTTGWPGTTAALMSNGRVFTWGYNNVGACGLGNTASAITIPTIVPNVSNVTDIQFMNAWSGQSGNNRDGTSLRVLCANGTSFACGANYQGELAIGNTTNMTTMTRENSNRSNIAAMGALNDGRDCAHLIIQNDGQVLFSGYKPLCGIPSAANATTTTTTFYNGDGFSSLGFQRNMLSNVGTPTMTPKIHCGASPFTGEYYQGGILDNTGNLYATGYNGVGNWGVGNTDLLTSFVQVNRFFPGQKRVSDFMFTGYQNASGGTAIVLQDGSVIGCGKNTNGGMPYEVAISSTTIPAYRYLIGCSPLNNN